MNRQVVKTGADVICRGCTVLPKPSAAQRHASFRELLAYAMCGPGPVQRDF